MGARAVSWRWALPQSLRDSSLTREPIIIDLKKGNIASLVREVAASADGGSKLS